MVSALKQQAITQCINSLNSRNTPEGFKQTELGEKGFNFTPLSSSNLSSLTKIINSSNTSFEYLDDIHTLSEQGILFNNDVFNMSKDIPTSQSIPKTELFKDNYAILAQVFGSRLSVNLIQNSDKLARITTNCQYFEALKATFTPAQSQAFISNKSTEDILKLVSYAKTHNQIKSNFGIDAANIFHTGLVHTVFTPALYER